MKILAIFTLAVVFLPHVKGQMKESDLQADLLLLLKSKRDFEKFSRINEEKGMAYKENYKKRYADIVKNKVIYLSFINKAIKDDEAALSKKYVFYNYQPPESSFIDPKNHITQLAYFKVVKFCLENKKELFPEISDIPFKTASNAI